MVTLRLQRRGRKKLPVYKIVATDSRAPRDGRFIEAIGRYEPLREPAVIEINRDRVRYWLSVGAQPSDTVRSLLRREGVYLEMHLERKGKSPEEIAAEVDAWRRSAAERLQRKGAKKRRRLMEKGEEVETAVNAAPEAENQETQS
ncbi:MAG: 30S ribosomal protein S16 [Bacteroidota bacterium]|nr:30S ribosomal protein S16 [Bacteroidota bacterium]